MRQFLLLVCLVGLVAARCGQRKQTVFDSDEDNCGSHSVLDIDDGVNNQACGRGGPFGGGCCLQQSNSVATSTSAIARLLISAGEKMQRFCNAYSDRAMREVYGCEHFQLRVRLDEFTDDQIQVRVRQRLVSVHARSCSEQFAAVRILPEVVDAQRAVWKFEGGTLTVFFPYSVSSNTQVQSRCGSEVSNSVITVPQCAADTIFDPDYDVSFGDAKLRAAIRNYLTELANKSDESKVEYIDP